MIIKDKILIVEDERSISNFIKAILSSNGIFTEVGVGYRMIEGD